MISNERKIHIVGAGLAGSECALQLANMGYQVVLYEMRQAQKMTPAHKTQDFAELVCSNSFGSQGEISGPGQLKREAELLKCEVLKSAQKAKVPAGQALGVDRHVFAQDMTEKVQNHPNITVKAEAVTSIDKLPRPAVIATGPLTEEQLATDLLKHLGENYLYFFDAISPIVDADSIDMSIAWKQDRYDKGPADYINCPLNKEEYLNFIEAIRNAKKIEPKSFEKTTYFEGCMPIEVFVERGEDTPRFGPMKPVGLTDPRTGKRPYAVVQLRQDNKEATAYNLVGFQTKMAYGDQKEVFRMIPGLQQAEFLKLGSIHRNLYVNSPKCLNQDLSSKNDPWLFLAGQITGVEGYFESTCMGLLVAHFLNQKLTDKTFNPPPRASALGSLLFAITQEEKDNFQPTNINFGLFPKLDIQKKISKKDKKAQQIQQAQKAIQSWHP